MTSIERLTNALIEAGAPEPLINEAKAGDYSDTQSKFAFPIVTLIRKLRDLGLHGIADRAIQGDFDATDEEWNAWLTQGGLNR